jgi:NADH:ubiquinone oxidoreductase subunit E
MLDDAMMIKRRSALIPLLQGVQKEVGYVSPDAVLAIAQALGIPEADVYGVATFYSEFKLFLPAEHSIKVCMGTSCYLCGGGKVLEHLKRRLSIHPGTTTHEGKFSLETVACLGCCSRSPVMMVDGTVHSHVSASAADEILSDI